MSDFLGYNGTNHENLARCLGALESAKTDLISRKLIPYERMKCDENGDVW